VSEPEQFEPARPRPLRAVRQGAAIAAVVYLLGAVCGTVLAVVLWPSLIALIGVWGALALSGLSVLAWRAARR